MLLAAREIGELAVITEVATIITIVGARVCDAMDLPMRTLSHPYRPKPWTMALAGAFFGAIAITMGREALLNERGLVISGLIHLGPGGATVFYWGIAAVAAAFVVVAVPAFVMGLVSTRRLTLDAAELSVPGSVFARAPTVVRLADIRSVSMSVIQKRRFFEIVHTQGKLTLSESLLPSPAAFEELCAEIARRSPGSKQG